MTKDDEKLLIGGLLINPIALEETLPRLKAELFTDTDNRLVFRALFATYNAGKDCRNPGAVAQAMQAICPKKSLTECCQRIMGYPSTIADSAEAHALADRLICDFRKTEIKILLARQLQHVDDPTQTPEEITDTVISQLNAQDHDTVGICDQLGDTLRKLYEQINKRARGEIKSLVTGFSQLDLCGGFNAGDLIVIAAETSQGKTSFALSLTLNFLRQNISAAFYSREMTDIQLAERLLSSASGVPAMDIRFSRTDPATAAKVDSTAETLRHYPLTIDEKASTCEDILASIRRVHRHRGLQVAVIDYLQILSLTRSRTLTEEQALGEITRKLKDLAKELGIVVIALSQLNRNSTDHVPTLARLRASGQIAEAADMAILIYRPEAIQDGCGKFCGKWAQYEIHNAAQIIVAKNRNGSLTDFLCGFKPECTAFYPAPISQRKMPAGYRDPEEIPF